MQVVVFLGVLVLASVKAAITSVIIVTASQKLDLLS